MSTAPIGPSHALPAGGGPLRWQIFCRVVDNFGDVGVCWRLAAELGARGHTVTLVIDDASALAWLAPAGAAGVTVVDWRHAELGAADPRVSATAADVLIEAFGCALPPAVIDRCFARIEPPVWINLEYLSAEPYAEAAHGLASPQFGPAGRRLDKWFFFPGFTERSGGLIREEGLLALRAGFDRDRWLESHGLAREADERVVSLFCYADAPVEALLATLAHDRSVPTLLLAAAGPASAQVERALGPSWRRGSLRARPLPWLAQAEFDHLLWAADINVVRGEDSFVRAQWAGVPFVWQAYPQRDGAHLAKLDAFLDAMAAPSAVRALFHAWNGNEADSSARGARSAAGPLRTWPDFADWRASADAWQRRLASQPDLVTRLLGFVAAKR